MLTRAPSIHSEQSAADDKRPHAVVIGSGFGGLAAAVRLGAKGYRVTVLERLDAPGGRAYVYRDDGFVFDAGPTIITLPFLFEELWSLCGRRLADDVDLRPLDPFYRIRFDDGATFEACADPERMRAEIAKFSPGDVAGYDAYMRDSERIYRVAYEDIGQRPFSTLAQMASAIPPMIAFRADRSVHAHVSKHIRDPRLRIALGFHPLFVGANPMTVTCAYSMISFLERDYGVHFAMGGTGSLVRGLAGLIDGQGGRIHCNAEVAEILVRDGRATGVRLASGETLAADIVVSNADSAWTYRKLLPETVRKRWPDRKIDSRRYSMSLFVWYFGTNRRYEDVRHHTIVLGPRYEALLADIFKRKHLAEDFSLYVHRPTATDPSMAPEGCDSFYALAPVPNLDGDTDWNVMAETYRRRIARRLSETILPGVEDHVVTSRVLTPLDFRDRLLSWKGAAFGLEPAILQTAWFRPHNQSEDIDGLYLVGAGTHPGAGVPGVLTSARILDKLVPHAATTR